MKKLLLFSMLLMVLGQTMPARANGCRADQIFKVVGGVTILAGVACYGTIPILIKLMKPGGENGLVLLPSFAGGTVLCAGGGLTYFLASQGAFCWAARAGLNIARRVYELGA